MWACPEQPEGFPGGPGLPWGSHPDQQSLCFSETPSPSPSVDKLQLMPVGFWLTHDFPFTDAHPESFELPWPAPTVG